MDTPRPESEQLLASPLSLREEIHGLLAARGARGKLAKDENVVGENLAGCHVIETSVFNRTGVRLPAAYIYAFALNRGDQQDAASSNTEALRRASDREWIRGYLFLDQVDHTRADYPEGDDLASLLVNGSSRLESLSSRQRWAATKAKRVSDERSPLIETRKISPDIRRRIINQLIVDVENLLESESSLRLLTADTLSAEVLDAATPDINVPELVDAAPIASLKKRRMFLPISVRRIWQRLISIDVSEVPNKIAEGIVVTILYLLTALMWIVLVCATVFLLWFVISLVFGIIEWIIGLFAPR